MKYQSIVDKTKEKSANPSLSATFYRIRKFLKPQNKGNECHKRRDQKVKRRMGQPHESAGEKKVHRPIRQ